MRDHKKLTKGGSVTQYTQGQLGHRKLFSNTEPILSCIVSILNYPCTHMIVYYYQKKRRTLTVLTSAKVDSLLWEVGNLSRIIGRHMAVMSTATVEIRIFSKQYLSWKVLKRISLM